MSIGSIPSLPPPFVPLPPALREAPNAPTLRKFTVDEYERMVEAGVVKTESVEFDTGIILCRISSGAEKPTARKWTVEEYERLIELGVLRESEPVELLGGWIVNKMARNTPHDTALDKTEEAIRRVLPLGWRLRSQRAIKLGESMPEPDCSILSGDLDAYESRHPEPRDIAFLVEISATSVDVDRRVKRVFYGRGLVPIYWIVNVPDRQVEVYTDPTGPTDPPEAAGYRTTHVYRETDSVPVVIAGQTIAQLPVAGLLPRA